MKLQIASKPTKGGRTCRRILETASAMMAERGPDGVSMREISARLKITKPVLYYYFKDKEELIKAAFIEGTKHFDELNNELNNPSLTLEHKLARIFSNHLDFIKRYPDMPKCALKIMASPSSGVLSSMAIELKHRNRTALRKILEATAGKEGISRSGIDVILHMVSAVIAHFMIEAREQGAASLDKKLPARLARLICAGARHVKTVLIIILFIPMLSRAQALDLSVDNAVDLAFKNNTSVMTAEKNRAIYKEKIKEYWGGVYPQLSAGASYTRNIEKSVIFFGGQKIKMGLDNSYSGSLDLNQVLWAGGRVRTGITMAGIYSDSSSENLRAAQSGVKKAVKQLYYAVLLSKAMAGIQKETLELAIQHLATIEAQYKQGLASDLTVLRQKVEVSNNEPAVTQNLNYYEEGLLELKDLLGLEPDSEIKLSGGINCGPALPGSLPELYGAAMAKQPQYRQARLQKALAVENVTLEKAGHYPNLYAFASKQYQGQTDSAFPSGEESSWSTAAGVKLSLPLFAGGATMSRVKQARLELDIADENLKKAERELKITVKKAWLDLNEAAQRKAAQETSVETARKALTATEIRFKNGLAGQLEINDATLALNKAQIFYTQAQHDVCSASAELDWAAGE
ncbi:MAG: hypothetical protein A2X34_07545 [Elusimicrobia bacterium GWC2_51_8]|nr:MAG: hypothetical protein A2X33_05480 [Elusimicrobia bacterium GWA2_51_34]OGR64279.1 MAG: hypothetical protein A2X34_07545 [Elusimicrobia bacterium GWC2_51_8]HAF96273.1 hypothetical protein [Elusimicrobiota bacterium]HCE96973.1 hypothetical protein [Elusimicrobiota bacterium]